jgi:U3 small nucleolar RNA-associated protein 16
MLSKLLQYAQNILTFQLPVSLADIETEAPPVNPTMVTTRRQSGSNSDPATDVSSALESLPQDVRSAGSKKRRRPQAADEPTPPAVQDDSAHATTRKRQKLPVREKDEEHFERHTHIAVEIPVRDITQDNAPMWAAPEQGKFKGKRVLAEDKPSNPEVQEGDNQNGDEPEEGRSLSPVPQEAADEVALLHGTSGKTLRERGRRMKAGSRLERNMKLTPEPIKVADTSKTAKPKHKRFDSEEPAAEEFDQVVKDEAEVEEEDESSDDDAPEVVATQDAQEKAIVTARSAAKAVEE